MTEWLAYAVVWSLLKLTGGLPRTAARALAVRLSRVLFAITPKLRKTAEFNLKLAFPEWTDAQRQATLRGMVRSLGWMAAEFARLPRYTSRNIEEVVILDGNENFLEGQRRGKGVLFFDGAPGRVGALVLRARVVWLPVALPGAAPGQRETRCVG